MYLKRSKHDPRELASLVQHNCQRLCSRPDSQREIAIEWLEDSIKEANLRKHQPDYFLMIFFQCSTTCSLVDLSKVSAQQTTTSKKLITQERRDSQLVRHREIATSESGRSPTSLIVSPESIHILQHFFARCIMPFFKSFGFRLHGKIVH
jgi:hypothetical protein